MFRAITAPQAASNEGAFRPFEIRCPDGTVFTPYYTSAEPQAGTGTCEIHGVFVRERTG